MGGTVLFKLLTCSCNFQIVNTSCCSQKKLSSENLLKSAGVDTDENSLNNQGKIPMKSV